MAIQVYVYDAILEFRSVYYFSIYLNYSDQLHKIFCLASQISQTTIVMLATISNDPTGKLGDTFLPDM